MQVQLMLCHVLSSTYCCCCCCCFTLVSFFGMSSWFSRKKKKPPKHKVFDQTAFNYSSNNNTNSVKHSRLTCLPIFSSHFVCVSCNLRIGKYRVCHSLRFKQFVCSFFFLIRFRFAYKAMIIALKLFPVSSSCTVYGRFNVSAIHMYTHKIKPILQNAIEFAANLICIWSKCDLVVMHTNYHRKREKNWVIFKRNRKRRRIKFVCISAF